MTTQILTRRETQWIAEGAQYVYKDEHNNIQQTALTYRQVQRRMLHRAEHDMLHSTKEHEGQRFHIVANGWGILAQTVHQMDVLVSMAMHADEDAFDFEFRWDNKLIRVEERELGQYYRWLAHLIRAVFDDELSLDRFRLPPHAEVFRDVVKEQEATMPVLSDCFGKLPTFYDTKLFKFCGQLANEQFAMLRREALARGLSTDISARKADGKRAHKRMRAFKDECFAKQKELHLLVVECVYPPEPTGLGPLVPLAQTKNDHATFVNRLRGNAKFAAAAIGGIWTLAWGAHKGHHYRWIFMLDASQVQDRGEWVELVGDVWADVARDGGGYVRLPGADDPSSAVAGRLHADDVERMALLDDEIEYIAQKDNFIQLKETEGVRSWGTWVPANTREDRRRKRPAQPEANSDT